MAKKTETATLTPPPVESWPAGAEVCYFNPETGEAFYNLQTAKKHFTRFETIQKTETK